MKKLPSLLETLMLDLLLEADQFPLPPDDILSPRELDVKKTFEGLVDEGWIEEVDDDLYVPTEQARNNRTVINRLAQAISRSGVLDEPPPNTKEYEAACNGEIDLIPANEVGDDILEELDDWSEIGWLLLECGCLANQSGMALHGSVEGHLENQKAEAPEH